MCSPVYLLLGSNKGNRLRNIEKSLLVIHREVSCVRARSSVYWSSPWGKSYQGSPSFLNQAIAIDFSLSPLSLLRELMAIERCMGREQNTGHLPRTIDIDILLFDDCVISNSNLTIPHPLMALRRFALTPLAEIAPDFIHPLLGVSISQLLLNCKDPLSVRLYDSDKEKEL